VRVRFLLDSAKTSTDSKENTYKNLLFAIEGLHKDLPFSPEEATELVDSLDLDLLELTEKSSITKAFFAKKFIDLGLKVKNIEHNKFIFE